MSRKITVTLPEEVWGSVDKALLDFLRFGPGELDAEYIPDEHLEKARKAIDKAAGEDRDAASADHEEDRRPRGV